MQIMHLKIHFFGDEIEMIEIFDPISKEITESVKKLNIYPANMFATSPDVLQNAIDEIRYDLKIKLITSKKLVNFWKQKDWKKEQILI